METELTLRVPAASDRAAVERYKREMLENGDAAIDGGALLERMDFDAWLENLRRNSRPETVRRDWVVSSTFLAVRQRDGALVGMLDVRHSLDNPFLRDCGGHIGYSVGPSARRKGFGTEILRLGLAYARSLGLRRVMLGCRDDNTASKRTILRCGGVLTEQKTRENRTVDVWWIHLTEEGGQSC